MDIKISVSKKFEESLTLLKNKYGEEFQFLNGFHPTQLDPVLFQKEFKSKNNLADITIDSSANVHKKDVRSLISEKNKPLDKLDSFDTIYNQIDADFGEDRAYEWLEEEYTGGSYMHDAPSASTRPYCFAYDLGRLAREGLFFLDDYNYLPAKHLTTFLDDVIEYISYMSNRSSGATGIPNILIWTYYFWKKDIENGYYLVNPDYYIRQMFQKLIYRLNQPFMRIVESAFVNVSIFDRCYIESLFGGLEYPDGTFAIDYVDDIIEHQKIFMEVVAEIREKENMFTFPVLSYSLLKRDDITEEEAKEMIRTKNYNVFVDNEFARWCSDHNCEWNDSNFFLSKDVTTLSNCCRLLSDTSKLSGFVNSIGGTALSIGSIKVNTINLNRIALEARSVYGDDIDKCKQLFLDILRRKTQLCCDVLYSHRQIIKNNIECGLLPNYTEGGVEIDKQYSTIGILGLFEVIEEFGMIIEDEFDYKYYSDSGVKFASEIFDVLNEVKDSCNYDFSFNIESVPAERAAVILCQKDNILYGRDSKLMYSNQWIPLTSKCTIQEKLKLSSILDKMCSGGSIAHINLESNFPNKEAAWDMLNQIALADVIYFAFNTFIQECKNRHRFVGSKICPKCSEPSIDSYQRIVGYLVPRRTYSKERKLEVTGRWAYSYAEMFKD